MSNFGLRPIIAAVLLLGLAGAGHAPVPPEGESASPWLDLTHSRARLIAADGLEHDGRPIQAAGLEITLDKGWKTYWRTPGDGLAPMLDWSGSERLAEAEALWPVPKRIEGPEGVLAFGYADRLVLPIRIVPAVPEQGVRFKLSVQYAVCADICVPIEAELELAIAPGGGESPQRGALMAALERVPRKQARGTYCPHSFITAKRRVVKGKPALLIKTAYQEGSTGLDLFAERSDGLDLPPARRQPRASRGRLYHLVGFDSEKELDDLVGKQLTITMAADQGSCETSWRME